VVRLMITVRSNTLTNYLSSNRTRCSTQLTSKPTIDTVNVNRNYSIKSIILLSLDDVY
jgi:hypothetical protein